MLRHSGRWGFIVVALGGAAVACGSSNDVPADQGGTGGFSLGGFPGITGGFASVDSGVHGGATGSGGFGAGGFGFGSGGAGGFAFGNGGGISAGGVSFGGAGSGGSPASGGASTDGGLLDGSSLDGGGDGTDAGAGAGGTPGSGGAGTGGTGTGGAGTGGTAAGGAGTGGTAAGGAGGGPAVCGNSIKEGAEACDEGGIDTSTCDADCTKPVCGDKHLNFAAGEFCDDGNLKNGDGCDSTCQLENTCPAAAPIALTAGVPGTIQGTVSDDSSDGTSYVNPALCDGSPRGSGPDALYSFTLDRTRNVTLSLTAGFDAILRTYTKACVPGAGLNEANGDACSNTGVGTESMSFSRLAKGTYYVVVDGASGTDKGTYKLDVSATCDGIDDLRIVELGIGATDYAVIRNMSDCPASLGGGRIRFLDSRQPEVAQAFPTMTLAPGEQLRIQENLVGTVPGAISAPSIPFQYDRGGTVLLCKTDCSTAADVLDVVQFADGDPTVLDPPPNPPLGITSVFPLTGINASNQNTESWVRVGTTGKNPNFTGGDYCTGEPNAAFGLRLEEVFIGEPDFVSMKNHTDCALPIAPFRARLSTGGVSTPIDAMLDAAGTLSLAKGATLFLSEPPSKGGDVSTGVAIPNAGGISGTVQLCLGSCATAGATVDAIAWDGVLAAGGTPMAFPPLPTPITFSPDALQGLTDANQGTQSYRRAAIAGTNSHFFASDWNVALKSR